MSRTEAEGHRAKRVLVIALAFAALAMITAWALSIHTTRAHPGVPVYSFIVECTFTAVTLTAIATLLVLRRPDHRVTWVCTAIVVATGAQALTGSWAHEALLGQEPAAFGGEIALLTSSAAQSSSVLLTILVINLFPTGTATTRRWSTLVWLTMAAIPLAALGPYLTEHPWAGDPEFPWFESVKGTLYGLVPDVAVSVVFAAGAAVTLLALLGTPVHVIVRFRRSRGIERAQLKWLVYAFLAALTILLLPWSSPALSWSGVDRLPGWVLWTLAPVAIWASIATAVLRYRLYDIDRVVSRTVSYALLTGALIGVYALGVLGIGALLPGERSDLLVAGSTLAVAALVRPLRSRIQSLVDRRFNRAGYDAARTVASFGTRLRDQVAVEAVADDLVTTVANAMAPRRSSVWLAGAQR